MRNVLTGQALLIVCFVFYLIWWYRGYRPGVSVDRVRGLNGLLLLLTVAFGIAGVALSLMPGTVDALKIKPATILIAAVALYILLLIVTRLIFRRAVTTELFLIVAWTALEAQVVNSLNASGALSDGRTPVMICVLALAFAVSLILYVAYYRMEEMKAFYAAMVPLIAGQLSTALLLLLALL